MKKAAQCHLQRFTIILKSGRHDAVVVLHTPAAKTSAAAGVEHHLGLSHRILINGCLSVSETPIL